jgi:hypothetical protein
MSRDVEDAGNSASTRYFCLGLAFHRVCGSHVQILKLELHNIHYVDDGSWTVHFLITRDGLVLYVPSLNLRLKLALSMYRSSLMNQSLIQLQYPLV